MIPKRTQYVAAGWVALIAVLGVAQQALQGSQAPLAEAPVFEVDPLWPKPLPNQWVLGTRSASASIRATTCSSSTGRTR